MTNATKALVITFINSLMAVAVSFGTPLSEQQQGAIALAVNAGLSLWVALTYKNSPKRVPDEAQRGWVDGF